MNTDHDPGQVTAQPLDPLNFPLHGQRLIEASAGTGKTFTIALLYVRLVLGHGDAAAFARPLVPPEILVVTFTEAATQELRERIRARLGEAARCFAAGADVDEGADEGDGAAFDPLLLALRESYAPAQWPACARRLQLAAEWMDEAAVATIHGWCYRMLREHAFDSGSLFNQELLADEGELLDQVVRDYWRRTFYPLPASAVAELLRSFADPQALRAALQPLLARPQARLTWAGATVNDGGAPADLLARVERWRQRQAQCEAEARQAWHADVDGLAALLRQLRPDLNAVSYPEKKDDGRFEAWLAALADWAAGSAGALPELKLARLARGRIKLNGKKAAPEHPAFSAIEALLEAEGERPDCKPQLLQHALHAVRAGLAQAKARDATLGFDDLLRRLDQALALTPELAQRIRAQFPVAMIDEFQDTDPLQYRLFSRVYATPPDDPQTASPPAGLFLIGDPKQAIYAFRGADIQTYLQAREATQGRHYTLATNFRSTNGVVRAVNQAFAYPEQQFPRAAFRFASAAGNPLPFTPVAARGRRERLLIDGAEVPALNVWQLPASSASGVVGVGAYRSQMAERSASAICGWLAAARRQQAGFADEQGGWRPLRPADIAILVRGRGEAEAVRRALARRQLASVYLSDRDSVFASSQAADLLLWLQAAAEPGDEGRLRAALASASMARSWDELDGYNQDELSWEAIVLCFQGYKRIWQRQGVLPMLRRWLADFDVPARLLRQADGERALTNLLHLAEWLQRQASELDGEQALLRTLAEQLARPTQEEVLRLESDADLIKVVTIHKSKGLEYPLVLLPFICGWKDIDGRSELLAFHEVDDSGEARYTIELARDRARVERALTQANDERLSEDMRLLYVALTRARHAVWMGVAPLVAGNARHCELHKGAVGYLLGGGEPLAAADLPQALTHWRGDCTDIALLVAPPVDDARLPVLATAALGVARQPGVRARQPWWIASYSALRTGAEQAVSDDEPGDIDPAEGSEKGQAAQNGRLEPSSAREAALREAEVLPVAPPAGAEDDAATQRASAALAAPHAFPKGPGPGSFLHDLLEWAAQQGFARVAAEPDLLRDTVARRCTLRGWEHWIEPLVQWLQQLLRVPLPVEAPHVDAAVGGVEAGVAAGSAAAGIGLADVTRYQGEMEFWFGASAVDTRELDRLVGSATLAGLGRPALLPDQLNGMLKGYIDLVFEHQGRYYLADYKSNWLGADDGAYDAVSLQQAMRAHRYDLQYALYTLALHRLLRARLPDYDYDRHMGGVFYLFIRGVDAPRHGVLALRPARALVDALDTLFAAKTQEAA